MTKKERVNDLFRVFSFINRYSWAIARDEIIFLLVVDLYETLRGVKACKVTQILKRNKYITQADKNRTWVAGKKLIKKGLLSSPKVGYYITTPLGRERSRRLVKELELHNQEFKLNN